MLGDHKTKGRSMIEGVFVFMGVLRWMQAGPTLSLTCKTCGPSANTATLGAPDGLIQVVDGGDLLFVPSLKCFKCGLAAITVESCRVSEDAGVMMCQRIEFHVSSNNICSFFLFTIEPRRQSSCPLSPTAVLIKAVQLFVSNKSAFHRKAKRMEIAVQMARGVLEVG